MSLNWLFIIAVKSMSLFPDVSSARIIYKLTVQLQYISRTAGESNEILCQQATTVTFGYKTQHILSKSLPALANSI